MSAANSSPGQALYKANRPVGAPLTCRSAICWVTVLALLCGAAPLPPGEKTRESRARKLAKLFDALETDDLDARRAAIAVLEAFIGKDEIEGVAKGARDGRIRVRQDAIGLLWRYRGHSPAEPPDIHDILRENLRHKDAGVRAVAATVAEGFAGDSPALLKALAAALDDHAICYPPDKGTVSEYAAMSLGKVGTKARMAYPALMKAAAQSKHRLARGYSLCAIGRLAAAEKDKQPQLLAFLIRRLERGETFFDRGTAAGALGYLGPAAAPAVPALRKAYRCEGIKYPKDRSEIRRMILHTYKKIGRGAKAALPDLLPALRDKKEDDVFRARIAGFAWELREEGKAAWPEMRRIAADETEDTVVRKTAQAAIADVDARK